MWNRSSAHLPIIATLGLVCVSEGLVWLKKGPLGFIGFRVDRVFGFIGFRAYRAQHNTGVHDAIRG